MVLLKNKSKVFFLALTLVFILSTLGFQNIASAEDNISFNGDIITGLLFDATVTEEMKEEMIKEDRQIIATENGEMLVIPADPFSITLTSHDNKKIYKTVTTTSGEYTFENLENGQYTLSIDLGDTTFEEENISIQENVTFSSIIAMNLDKFVEETMHSDEELANTEENANTPILEEDKDLNTDDFNSTEETVSYSHKSPHLPCLDYNGPNAPNKKHVHDWNHFYKSDCFLAVYYRCATDHKNALEFCDGTRNCSYKIWPIAHSRNYHKH